MSINKYIVIKYTLDETKTMTKYKKLDTAYRKINECLIGLGFEPYKDDSYISKNTMTIKQLNQVIADLTDTNRWMMDCAKSFDVSEIDGVRAAEPLVDNVPLSLGSGKTK